jgi:hypothetical protein
MLQPDPGPPPEAVRRDLQGSARGAPLHPALPSLSSVAIRSVTLPQQNPGTSKSVSRRLQGNDALQDLVLRRGLAVALAAQIG